jgi:hypothetical protein
MKIPTVPILMPEISIDILEIFGVFFMIKNRANILNSLILL